MSATTEYTKQGQVPFILPNPEHFQEVQNEQLVKFANFGQAISGRVLFVRKVTIKGQSAVECGLQTTSGRVKFFLNYDLQQKITTDDLGRVVAIVYDHDEDTGGESPMRKYRVWMSTKGLREADLPAPKVANRAEDVGITDSDIPF
jgi:hypothetical protein